MERQRAYLIPSKEELVTKKKAKTTNKSKFFLMPLIGVSKSYRNVENTYLILNTNKDEITESKKFDSIYLKVYNKDDVLELNKNFVSFIDLKDKGIFYEFKIPDKFSNELHLFLNGKYSEYSDEAIMMVLGIKDPNMISKRSSTFEYGVFFKTRERRRIVEDSIGQKLPRDAELYSIVNINDEIYE